MLFVNTINSAILHQPSYWSNS